MPCKRKRVIIGNSIHFLTGFKLIYLKDETLRTPDRPFTTSQSPKRKRLKSPLTLSQSVSVAALKHDLTSVTKPSSHTAPRVYPLSRKNLRLLNTMNNGESAFPITPCPSRSATSSASITDTPGRQSKSRSSLDAGELMERYHLFGLAEGNAAFASHEDFKAMVQGIVTGDRASSMKPGSQKKFIENRAELATRNEITLMGKLMPILVRDSRTISTPQGDLVCDWGHDNLDANINLEFIRSSVPIPDVKRDQILAKLLEKYPGMKNPKPDIAYGLSRKAFTKKELAINDTYASITGISPRILHPFIIFEWKNAKGTMEDARCQARRGGAALVHARRQFNALASCSPEPNGPDWSSFVFSCTANPDTAYIYVHWCEREDDQLSWHMSRISAHLLDEEEDIKVLRRNINNVLDWGVLNRVQEIKSVLRKICEQELGSSNVPTASPNKRRKIQGALE